MSGTATQGDPTAINGLYLAILNRPATSSELALWENAYAGGETYGQIAAGLANGPEAQADIKALVVRFLTQPPSAGSAILWTQYLATGGTVAGMSNTLMGIALQGLPFYYQSYLNRAVGPGEYADWLLYMQEGGSLGGMIGGIVNSVEGQADIANLYTKILGHAIDPGADADWTQYLVLGGTLNGIANALIYSPEIHNDIASDYEMVDGRAAVYGEYYNWTLYLSMGGSFPTILNGIATSGESYLHIYNLYEADLGRPLDLPSDGLWINYLENGGSLAVMTVSIAYSGEAQGKVSALLQTDYGTAPSAAAVSAGQLQLADGLSLTDLNTQTLMLGASPQFLAGNGGTVAIPPTGVNGVAINTGNTVVTGFNPAQDVLQLLTSSFPNLAAVQADETATSGGVLITSTVSPTVSVLLQGVSQTSLVAANFQFH